MYEAAAGTVLTGLTAFTKNKANGGRRLSKAHALSRCRKNWLGQGMEKLLNYGNYCFLCEFPPCAPNRKDKS